jgi:hypothetical protein
MWITVRPDDRQLRCHASRENATAWALRANKRDSLAYELWEIGGKRCRYVGHLWRAFGRDFDPERCWKLAERAVPTEWPSHLEP